MYCFLPATFTSDIRPLYFGQKVCVIEHVFIGRQVCSLVLIQYYIALSISVRMLQIVWEQWDTFMSVFRTS